MTEQVLVDGYTFFVSRPDLSVGSAGGLFHRDTRYLSELSVSVEGEALTHVGTHLRRPQNRVGTFAALTSDVNELTDSEAQKHPTSVLQRDQIVAEGTGFHEQLRLFNHSPTERTASLGLQFDLDFADIFEVRDIGTEISRQVDVEVGEATVTWSYEPARGDGVDGRQLSLGFDPTPEALTETAAAFEIRLAPQESAVVDLVALPEERGQHPAAAAQAVRAAAQAERPTPSLETLARGQGRYTEVFEWAARDLEALLTETEHGPVPLAGVPWFATVFGRDALVTAFETVHLAPRIAVGTLRYLAANQGTTADTYSEEQPGKILHEMRHGELAQRSEIPHTPYYGTVDATPLWVVLLHETVRWTGDEELLDELWDNVVRAMGWLTDEIDRIGDDPFLYYEGGADRGLQHKAWRDTEASVQFADGRPATPPLAAVEVQGYAYDAFVRAASLARDVGESQHARTWSEHATAIADQFDDAFWLPETEFFGVALTVDGRVVDSVTSNVGHCLWSGLVEEERAPAVVDRLRSTSLDAGWGVRTMSSQAAGFSPVSYHVGSVWPHDNALLALGCAAYGFRDAAVDIAIEVLDACRAFDEQRVPELYCGFGDEQPPVPYPAACEPQAWSAATPFAMARVLFEAEPAPGHDRYAVPAARPDHVDIAADAMSIPQTAVEWPEHRNGN